MVQPILQKYWVSNYENVFEFNHKPDAALQSDKNYIPIRLIDSSIAKPGILYSDRKNQVWLGTINALYKFNSARSRPERFQPQTEILNNGITAIQQMENGIYIFGARFGGIVLMKDTSIIGNITEKQGLLSNAIKYLLVLNNDIWVATAKGISVIRFQSYNPLKYTIVNIGKNDGLYDVIIFQLMPYRGAILASTSNGIYEIDRPDELLNKQPKPIPFFINSVSYYKADTNAISSITLPYNNNRVVIKYGAICFNSPEEIKYSYRLGLKDTSWHSISSTELLLENLIPGTYNLELKAEIPGQHRFSGIMALRIIVESAWWQNIWLILTAIGMLSLIFILIYKRRIRVIEKREEQNSIINRRMTELEQAALRSQMNPHFIFNCLTSIQHLIVAGNKTEASEYLVKFGRLIRKTMDLSIYSYITIEEELNYLTEYMVLEQLRIPDQFDYFIDVDPVIDKHHLLIQSMMLQPIVENCIRHGIKHLKDRKGIITISMKRSENYIDCIITDNGIGRDANLPDASKNTYTEHKSYGLNIVKKRLATLHGTGQDEMIGIQDLYDSSGSVSGTCVTIHLPFKKTDKP